MIEEFVDQIKTKNDFLKFLSLLKDNFLENKNDWSNINIESYVEGIYGFTNDIEGFLKTASETSIEPSWKLFAQILLAARVYE